MMNEKKKAIAFTAFMIFISLVIVISLFFGIKSTLPSPLGKTIIKYFVYPDGTPIGKCLEVELWNDGLIAVGHTDSDGKVVFSGLIDETYTFEYEWQGVPYEEMVRIDCSQIIWEFTNEVPYWTFEKQFYYDETEIPPTKELNVTLYYPEGSSVTKTTVEGFVSFDDLKAGEYTVEWVWGSETKTEDFTIGFQTPSPVEMTNYLEPKSGGGV